MKFISVALKTFQLLMVLDRNGYNVRRIAFNRLMWTKSRLHRIYSVPMSMSDGFAVVLSRCPPYLRAISRIFKNQRHVRSGTISPCDQSIYDYGQIV